MIYSILLEVLEALPDQSARHSRTFRLTKEQKVALEQMQLNKELEESGKKREKRSRCRLVSIQTEIRMSLTYL